MAYGENGNVINLRYDPFGHSFSAYDANKRPITVKYAYGTAPATGKECFTGTDYVDGVGFPDCRDTVPAKLTKGERVMTVDQNKQLAGITNEQVVGRVKVFDKFLEMYPQAVSMYPGYTKENGMTQSAMHAQLRLPDWMMNQPVGKVNVDLSELRADLQAIRSDLKNQKQLAVNIDKGGFSTALLSAQGKTEYVVNQLTQ